MLDHNHQITEKNIIQTQQIALIPNLQDKVNRFECPYCDHIFLRQMDREQHIRKGSELTLRKKNYKKYFMNPMVRSHHQSEKRLRVQIIQ